jgi:hypothetical protein
MLQNLQNQPTDGEDQSDLRFRHITEITILTVQLIVEFAKRLPGFDKLLREDQIALLKVQSVCLNKEKYGVQQVLDGSKFMWCILKSTLSTSFMFLER